MNTSLKHKMLELIGNGINEYKLDSTERKITDSGLREIIKILMESENIYISLGNIKRHIGPMVVDQENGGKFVKRLNAWVRETYIDKRLTDSINGKIGEIVGNNIASSGSLRFDITDRFNWEAGDFGDSGSCYWGDHESAKDVLNDNDALAIRFYDKTDNGVGRSWIATTHPEDCLIIFNAYGDYSLSYTAIFLSKYLGVDYKKIELRNYGSYTELVYINSGNAYILGNTENIESVKRYDLSYDIDSYENDNDRLTCYECGDYIEDGDDYNSDGDTLCMDCFQQNYFYCERCNSVHHIDNACPANDYLYCESCYSQYFAYCRDCDTDYSIDDVILIGGEYKCEDCAKSSGFEKCYECEEWNSDFITDSDITICADCAEKFSYWECSHCHRINQYDKWCDFCDLDIELCHCGCPPYMINDDLILCKYHHSLYVESLKNNTSFLPILLRDPLLLKFEEAGVE